MSTEQTNPSEADSFFIAQKEVEARAFFLGQRIDLKALEIATKLAESPCVISAGNDGYAVLFRYGVAVLFGMKALEETSFIKDLMNYVIEPFEEPSKEEGLIQLGKTADTVTSEHISLRIVSMEHMQIIADVLAKSAVLNYYEQKISETFDRIEPIASGLQRNGAPTGKQGRALLRHIGYTLSIQRKMVGQVEIEDKPELLWEKPEFERLFARLEDEYELKERINALERKIHLIHQTAETMLGLLQEKRSLHVEWYIVGLIVIEILMTLAEKIFHI